MSDNKKAEQRKPRTGHPDSELGAWCNLVRAIDIAALAQPQQTEAPVAWVNLGPGFEDNDRAVRTNEAEAKKFSGLCYPLTPVYGRLQQPAIADDFKQDAMRFRGLEKLAKEELLDAKRFNCELAKDIPDAADVSMSMFASKADYDAVVKKAEQPTDHIPDANKKAEQPADVAALVAKLRHMQEHMTDYPMRTKRGHILAAANMLDRLAALAHPQLPAVSDDLPPLPSGWFFSHAKVLANDLHPTRTPDNFFVVLRCDRNTGIATGEGSTFQIAYAEAANKAALLDRGIK